MEFLYLVFYILNYFFNLIIIILLKNGAGNLPILRRPSLFRNLVTDKENEIDV